MEFSRQEYWSGLSFLSPGDLPNPGIEPVSPALQVTSLLLSHQGSPNSINSIMSKKTNVHTLIKNYFIASLVVQW